MAEVRVLYVGDSGLVFGPLIFESPFLIEVKDAYVREWGSYLIEAVRRADPKSPSTTCARWTRTGSSPAITAS